MRRLRQRNVADAAGKLDSFVELYYLFCPVELRTSVLTHFHAVHEDVKETIPESVLVRAIRHTAFQLIACRVTTDREMRFLATRTVADAFCLALHKVLQWKTIPPITENDVGARFFLICKLKDGCGLTFTDEKAFVVYSRLHDVLESNGRSWVSNRLLHRVRHQTDNGFTAAEAGHHAAAVPVAVNHLQRLVDRIAACAFSRCRGIADTNHEFVCEVLTCAHFEMCVTAHDVAERGDQVEIHPGWMRFAVLPGLADDLTSDAKHPFVFPQRAALFAQRIHWKVFFNARINLFLCNLAFRHRSQRSWRWLTLSQIHGRQNLVEGEYLQSVPLVAIQLR